VIEDNENVQEMEFAPREPGTLPWFQFWSNRWMGSDTITRMSLAHQAIYLRMMCVIQTYGSLSRDPWVLSKKLDVRYDTLLTWMAKNINEGEVIHAEGCSFTGSQPLACHYVSTPNSELGRSGGVVEAECSRSQRVVDTECLCGTWTLPKFLKLQILSKKSSADNTRNPAGYDTKGKQNILLTSAARPPKSGKGNMETSSPDSGKNIPDAEFMDMSLDKQTSYSDPNCDVCSGDGTYSKKLDGTWQTRQTRCECSKR
jgi:hypothetical protein